MDTAKIYVPLIVALLSGGGWLFSNVYDGIKQNAELKAELKYKLQDDTLYHDYIALRMRYDMEHGH